MAALLAVEANVQAGATAEQAGNSDSRESSVPVDLRSQDEDLGFDVALMEVMSMHRGAAATKERFSDMIQSAAAVACTMRPEAVLRTLEDLIHSASQDGSLDLRGALYVADHILRLHAEHGPCEPAEQKGTSAAAALTPLAKSIRDRLFFWLKRLVNKVTKQSQQKTEDLIISLHRRRWLTDRERSNLLAQQLKAKQAASPRLEEKPATTPAESKRSSSDVAAPPAAPSQESPSSKRRRVSEDGNRFAALVQQHVRSVVPDNECSIPRPLAAGTKCSYSTFTGLGLREAVIRGINEEDGSYQLDIAARAAPERLSPRLVADPANAWPRNTAVYYKSSNGCRAAVIRSYDAKHMRYRLDIKDSAPATAITARKLRRSSSTMTEAAEKETPMPAAESPRAARAESTPPTQTTALHLQKSSPSASSRPASQPAPAVASATQTPSEVPATKRTSGMRAWSDDLEHASRGPGRPSSQKLPKPITIEEPAVCSSSAAITGDPEDQPATMSTEPLRIGCRAVFVGPENIRANLRLAWDTLLLLLEEKDGLYRAVWDTSDGGGAWIDSKHLSARTQAAAASANKIELPKVYKVLGDHRCLFRAILRSCDAKSAAIERTVQGEATSDVVRVLEATAADDMRRQLCEKMRASIEKVAELRGASKEEAELYIKSMEEVTTWGDAISLYFLATLTARPIQVYALNKRKQCLFDCGKYMPEDGPNSASNPVIYLWYNGVSHYDLLCEESLKALKSRLFQASQD
eukprot:TRINITY_DN26035_c0_g1_i1.p1 TRINITY_DN26035_c0_g1~~TRINITY_DN26035_c0_g1_i1.p1  ORF type:complete len:750 (+),score=165.07 TRINITY_DN26035_c0_g1_i1:149-2398(+)